MKDDTKVLTVAEGATLEIDDGGSDQSVTFTGTTGTLVLDDSRDFAGSISGLSGVDAIDLSDIRFGTHTTATFLGDTTGGTLTVTDGTRTANLALQGNYLSSTWTISSDGNGGTTVVDPIAPNNWQTLKVGAGGVITGIDVAADGTEVIRTDTYGAYIWNGSQWQQLVTTASMPAAFVDAQFGGTAQGVYEIQIAPSNTNIFYMMFDGFVFKSSDKGTTWTQTNLAQVTAVPNAGGSGMGEKMAIDPNNPNIVYVGSANGLFVTTDGGTTWASVSTVPAGLANANGSGIYSTISGILFDPAIGGVVGGKTQTIFASSNGNGVYQSTDGGTTWTLLSGGPPLVADAVVSSTGAYYATDGNSLWRYASGSWTQLYTQGAGQGLASIAVNPNNPNEIIGQTYSGLLIASFDGGTTWNGSWSSNLVNSTDIPWLAAANGNYLDVTHVLFNPLNPNQLISTAGTGVWTAPNPPSNYSPSSTVTWSDQSLGIEQLVANEIIVPPGGKPVLASWDRPLFYVSDPNSYPTSYGPVESSNIVAGWSVDYASSSPNFLVGLADWYGSEESGFSTDGGQTWTPFATEIPGAGSQFMGGTIAASSSTNFVWAPANGYAPYYTTNGGTSWNPVVLPGVTDWSAFDWAYYLDKRTVTADRVLSNTFYLYYIDSANDNKQGVYRSSDGGVTWTQTFSGPLTLFSGYNSEIESVPGEAGNLFFTGGLQGGSTLTQPANESFMRSTDGGATWSAIPNVQDVVCFGFGASATPGGYPAIYIVGWVNNVYGVWQSNNDAQSWTQIGTFPNNSLDQIKTISGDPNVYGQVYVGFSGSGYAVLEASGASSGPSVTGLNSSPSTGDLSAGHTTTLTLNLSSAVTVAGGVPTLTLNDGGVATYSGGSGTNALTFTYTVGTGQNTPSLSATAVNLNGATMQDSSGHATNLSLTGFTQSGPKIDTTPPSVTQVIASSGSGSELPGNTVTVTSTPTLPLNDGHTATYVSGTGSNALPYSDTVGSGDAKVSAPVIAHANLPNSAPITDGAGSANLSAALITFGGDKAPVVTASTQYMMRDQTIAASSPFTAIDFDNSASFAGTVAGMAGNDVLDLTHTKNPTSDGTSTGGVLTATDGGQTAIALLCNYMASIFTVSSDNHGTSVVDIPTTPPILGGGGQGHL